MFAVSIDPGKHVAGWALWDITGSDDAHDYAPLRSLIACGLWSVRVGDLVLPPVLGDLCGVAQIETVYLESMEVRGTGSKTPPADLVAVEGRGNLFAGYLRPKRLVTLTPTTWKGSVPKVIHHPRILHELASAEAAILDRAIKAAPKTNAKEILDAVGLGLYGLGRTHRGGVSR